MISDDKCIVFGCTNHKSQGEFVGNLCAPCHQYLTTGRVGPTISFLSALSQQPKCEITHSTKVKLDKSLRWNLKLDFNGYRPFEQIELEEMIIAGADVSRCRNYGEYEEAIVVVFEIKNRYQ